MSKRTASSTAIAASTRQPRPITAWLKENKSKKEKEAKENSDESESKKLKPTLRVQLELLDENILKKVQANNEPVKNQSQNKQDLQENKKEVQPSGLRRSARKLPPGEKPIEKPVPREPDIEDLPPILFKGRINYVSEFHDCARVCDTLLTQVENSKDRVVAIGFDLEWPFSFQTGSGKTALAQICLNEKECHLLHIYNLKKLPASLIALLSHSKVKLVGVNIKNDVWKLTRDFKEFPGQKVVDNNCLDCGPYANSVLNRSCRWSLERLTAYLLKKRISKDSSVRRSKWHIQPLSDKQKLYAATDAYVSLLLHLTIEQQEVLNQARLEEQEEAAVAVFFS
ncbi:Werner Syndrome-like exonuclease [Nasonia vitripennis]|uniref:3'-5' exonuclease n=1 Tax=Nasonia vitripennis TaxID=7425 RepID=A0A7M6UMY9_NASVI|nr:Werner Syndrome-like exonuclease [Nasonia vitripennis]